MCDPSDDVDELSASDDSEPEEEPSRAPFDPELDSDDDDDNNVEEAVVSTVAAQTPFSLQGGSLAFSDRSHSIFDCLDTQLSSSSLKQDHITNKVFVQPHSSHPSRKTSLPPSTSPTPPKKRGVPDYLVHPERWTCYSLEDVPETSDQDNRRAAHQFLSSLQHEKESDSPCNIQQRMVFSRPKRPLKEKTTDQVSAVKGQEKGMHLSHLEQEEEEGSEREKAGGGGTDEREDGIVERNEKEDTRRKTERPEEEKQKQVQKEKEEEEKIEEVSCGFASFRKTKSKNYRKNAEQEDN